MTRIYREGRKLLADFNVPEKVANWIRDGMLKFVSVELLRDVKADTREIPWVLDAVALLGADQPAVGILKSLSLTMARSTALQCRERVAFSRDNPTTGDKPPMADPTVSELMARLDKLEIEKKALETKVAEGESFQRKYTELQTQTHDEKVQAHRKAVLAVFEAPIKEKKILPWVREKFSSIYRVETDDVLKVTTADAEQFARSNPNPDAPRAPATIGATDPNDPAEKALMSVRTAVRSAASDPMNKDKPRDVLLVEAFKAQFRSDPDVAKGWQSAPGTVQ